jgi:hypothetical protein
MKYIFSSLSMFASCLLSAQSINLDAAQRFNQAWINKSMNTYTIVGGFRVVGTPYLFGEKLEGKVWAKEGQSTEQTFVSYNTLKQEVEVYMPGYTKPISKDVQTVDSFQLSVKQDGAPMVLLFVNSKHAGYGEKTFLQKIVSGKNRLFKQYRTELSNLTDNLAQRDVRQFDLTATYLYADEKNVFTKLKVNPRALGKEFSEVANINTIVTTESLSNNTELVLKQIFAHLNN